MESETCVAEDCQRVYVGNYELMEWRGCREGFVVDIYLHFYIFVIYLLSTCTLFLARYFSFFFGSLGSFAVLFRFIRVFLLCLHSSDYSINLSRISASFLKKYEVLEEYNKTRYHSFKFDFFPTQIMFWGRKTLRTA